MARFYNIEKSGIKNVIDEFQYEAYYKPQGWKIVSVIDENGAVTEVSSPKDETTIKNIRKVKKRAEKKNEFDDGLIKGKESEGAEENVEV